MGPSERETERRDQITFFFSLSVTADLCPGLTNTVLISEEVKQLQQELWQHSCCSWFGYNKSKLKQIATLMDIDIISALKCNIWFTVSSFLSSLHLVWLSQIDIYLKGRWWRLACCTASRLKAGGGGGRRWGVEGLTHWDGSRGDR